MKTILSNIAISFLCSRNILLLVLTVSVFGMVVPQKLAAQSPYTWIGGASNDWSLDANWSGTGVPGGGDVANFSSGTPLISIGIPANLLALNVSAGANLTLSPGIATPITIISISVDAASRMALGGNLNLVLGNPSVINGILVIGSPNAINPGGNLTISNGAELVVNGNPGILASFPMYTGGSKLTYGGGIPTTITGTENILPNPIPSGLTVTINNSAGVTLNANHTLNGTLLVLNGRTFTISMGRTLTVSSTGKVQMEGNATIVQTGSGNISYASGADLEYIGTGPRTIGGEVPKPDMNNLSTMDGDILVNKPAGSPVNSVAGILQVNGNFILQQGTWNINAVAGGSQLKLHGGTNEIVTGASLILPSGMPITPPGGNLFINSGSTLFNNGTLSVGAYAGIQIDGSAHIYGNNAVQYQATSATLRYVGALGITTTIQALPPIMQGGVLFEKTSGSATLGASTIVLGPFTVATQSLGLDGKTLQLSSYGRISAGASLNTNNGVLFVSDGVGVAKLGGLTVGMNGTLRLDGTGYVSDGPNITYNPNSRLLYTGGSNRIAGEVPTPPITINASLHVNKTPGTFVGMPGIPMDIVTLGPGARLVLTSGTVRTGGSGAFGSLRVQNTAFNAVTSGTQGMVVGALQRDVSSSFNAYIFPIGRGTNKYPFIVAEPSIAGTVTLEAEAFETNTGGAPIGELQGLSTTEYWALRKISGTTIHSLRVGVSRPSALPSFALLGSADVVNSTSYVGIGGTQLPLLYSTEPNTLLSNGIASPPFSAAVPPDRFFAIGQTQRSVRSGLGMQLFFNGINQAIYSLPNAAYDALSNFTAEALVRPAWFSGTPSNDPCVFSFSSSTKSTFSLNMGRFYSFLKTSNGGSSVQKSILPIFRANRYYHIAVSYNAGVITYYIDGKLFGTDNISLSPPTGLPFHIGANAFTNELWNGAIDEVRLWNTALPQTSIAAWKRRELDAGHPNAANLVGYWRLNDSFPETAKDDSPQANTAYFVGTPTWIDGSTNAGVIVAPTGVATGTLPATKVGTGSYSFSLTGANGGSTMASVSLDGAGNVSYAPNVVILQDRRDSVFHSIADPTVTTGSTTVEFSPFVTTQPQFVRYNRATQLLAPSVLGGTSPFFLTWTPTTNLTNTTTLQPIALLITNASYTLQTQDGYGFVNTSTVPVQIQPVTLAFSHASSTATIGFPPLINSGNPVLLRYGMFRKRSPYTLDTANASVSLHVAAAMGGNAQFSFKYDSTFTNTDRITASGIVINWLNAPLAGGTTSAVVTLFRTGGAPMDAAQVTVQISSNANAPIIASFAPQSAGTGSFVTITGANFVNVSSVRFGGIAAQNFVVVSSTQIRAQVGLGATGLLSVNAMAGSGNSLGVFTFAQQPSILSFTPTQGASGATVRVIGLNFIKPLSVRFGGVLSDSVEVVSPNELYARVGIGATGNIAVTTPGGTATSANVFTYFGAPFIVNISPTQGTAGDTISVNGGNFLNLDSVRIGTTAIDGVKASLVLPIQSSQIRIVLSTNALSGAVSVFTETGNSSSPQVFTYISPPLIDSIAPRVGGAGTMLTVYGKNFIQVDSVRFGAVRLNNVNVPTTTRLTAIMPSGLENSTGAIIVFARAGRDTSKVPNWFQYAAPPVITGFAPSAAGAGAWVEVTGANFVGVTAQTPQSVQFASIPADSLRFITPTRLQARVPLGGKIGRITITAAGGLATSLTDFRFVKAPTITTFSPQSASSGATIEILGSEFINLQRVILGNSVGVQVTLAIVGIPNETRIIAKIPGDALSGILTVVTSQGTVSSQNALQILVPSGPPPQITGLNPLAGEVGSEVFISGANFVNVASVMLNGSSVASFRVLSPTLVAAIIPEDASTGTIQLTTPNGTAFSLGRFTVLRSLANVGLSALQRDSAILVRFYQTTGGAWLREENWLTERPLSSWAGVQIAPSLQGDSARVVGLFLSNNSIYGNLPSFLSELTALRVLNLSNNFLEGTISSSIASMQALEELHLSNNLLSGAIPPLSTMASLRVLALDNNRLVGEFPRGACTLPNLREVFVQNNALSGVIPSCIGNLSRTERLNLSDNLFSGAIPPEIGSMTALQELRLAGNMLTGSIPALDGSTPVTSTSASISSSATTTATAQTKLSLATVYAVPALRVLDVSNNQLSGNMPESIGTLRQLQTALFQQNRFTGSIPTSIGNCTELAMLNMSNNQLSGILPASMGSLQKLKTLLLRGNSLTGSLPQELGRMRLLEQLHLDSNALTGLSDSLINLSALRQLTVSYNAISRLPQLRALDSLNVSWNRLEFPTLDAAQQVRAFVYHPQDSILTRIDTTIRVFTTFAISSGLLLGRHEYQWYRLVEQNISQNTSAQNAATPAVTLVQIQGQNQENLTFERFARGDTGVYTCFVRNSKYPALTLIRRTVRIAAFAPRAPQELVRLVAPLTNSQSIPITPVLRWTTLASVSGYEIQISTSADFSTLQWSFAVNTPFAASQLVPASVGLQNLTSYFWRVRAQSEGLVGAWSEVFRFTTQPANQPVNVETIDFGRVVIGRASKASELRLKNLSNVAIVIQDVQVEDAQILNFQTQRLQSTDATQHFRFTTSLSPTRLELEEELRIPILFTPMQVGEYRASVMVRFAPASGGAATTLSFASTLIGRGGILLIDSLHFGTMTAGITRTETMRIRNVGLDTVRIQNLSLLSQDTAQKTSFILSETERNVGGLIVRPNDSVFVNLNCRVLSDAPRGIVRGTATIFTNLDTVYSVPLAVDVRRPNQNDIFVETVLQPETGNDSIAPGGSVILTLKIKSVIKSTIASIVTSASLLDLFTANVTSRFTGECAFDANVLVPDEGERGIERVVGQSVNVNGRTLLLYRIPVTSWSPQVIAGVVGDSVLLRIRCRAISGDTNRTRLRITRLFWDNTSSVNKDAEVVVNHDGDGVFTSAACGAGGLRLTTTARANDVRIVSKNPASEDVRLSYAIREDGAAEIRVINMLGSVILSRVESNAHAGTYETTIPVLSMPSGAYLVQLITPSGVVVRRFEVVR